MSGGSFNYLYSKAGSEEQYTRELIDAVDELTAARARISGLGYADDVARAITEILDVISEFDRIITDRMDRIRDVLRALEWWDSNDGDEDRFRQALAELRERPTSPPLPTYELSISTTDAETPYISLNIYADDAPLPRVGERITLDSPGEVTVVVTDVRHWFDSRRRPSPTVSCEPAQPEDGQWILEKIAMDQIQEWTDQFPASRRSPRLSR